MPPSDVRVLFVCTKFGGRSVLAAHLLNRLSPWGEIASAASFDPGKLSQGYFRLLESLGYRLPRDQPQSLFEHYRQGLHYDYVVMMCCETCGEQCRIFQMSVNELYGRQAALINWTIPDLSLIGGTQEEIREGFRQVVGQLENHIARLIQQLAAGRPASSGAGDTAPAANWQLK